jgi:hypothetical protein
MAVTGKGDSPFRSAWIGRGRGRGRGANPRKIVTIAPTNSANTAVWVDWVFDAEVVVVATDHHLMLMGCGT